MPFLGHTAPDSATSDLSPADTPGVTGVSETGVRVARLVERVARDQDDRALLLEALGLVRPDAERLAG